MPSRVADDFLSTGVGFRDGLDRWRLGLLPLIAEMFPRHHYLRDGAAQHAFEETTRPFLCPQWGQTGGHQKRKRDFKNGNLQAEKYEGREGAYEYERPERQLACPRCLVPGHLHAAVDGG
jgi:hypothetical protein